MADQSTVLMGGGVGVAFSVITLIFFKFIKPAFTAANHHRVRSVCCGKTCVTSLDIEDTTPPVVVNAPPVPPVEGLDKGLSIRVPTPASDPALQRARSHSEL